MSRPTNSTSSGCPATLDGDGDGRAVATLGWAGSSASVVIYILILAVSGSGPCVGEEFELLVCVDGLASYVTAFTRAFRDPVRTGRRGRSRLEVISGLLWVR